MSEIKLKQNCFVSVLFQFFLDVTTALVYIYSEEKETTGTSLTLDDKMTVVILIQVMRDRSIHPDAMPRSLFTSPAGAIGQNKATRRTAPDYR